ncbi:MAG: arylamine N-acetyltransferase, partial [Thermostichus sp. DG02_4_bins_136]
MEALTPWQLTAYLDRIGYNGPTQPTLETLQQIHLAHLLTVPFENLDIHWGRPIRLERDPLFQKIVVERRGGFCFELNSLLAAALMRLGYSVQLLSGQVSRADGSLGPEFDHLALQVVLDDQAWLVDVGYGDSFRQPLRFGDPQIQSQEQGCYRCVPGSEERDPSPFSPRYWLVQQEQRCSVPLTRTDQTWKTLFRVDRMPRQLQEFEPMCRFHQTSPESMFTRLRLCTLATPAGRITLTARANGSAAFKWIETTAAGRRERTLKDEREYRQLL